MLHIPPTNYHLAAKQEPYQKAYFGEKKSHENGSVGRRKSRQKEQWEVIVKWNQMTALRFQRFQTGGWETSNIPGLPFRGLH